MTESEKKWLDRLTFYTRDLDKEQVRQLVRYVQFIKVKEVNDEGDKIYKLIEQVVL